MRQKEVELKEWKGMEKRLKEMLKKTEKELEEEKKKGNDRMRSVERRRGK